jgi:hypothetical protein
MIFRASGSNFAKTMMWDYFHRKRSVAPAILAIAGVLALGASLAAAVQLGRPARKAPAAANKQPTRDIAVPFNPGERLSFRVIWSKFSVNAATIQLAVVERRDFFGRAA